MSFIDRIKLALMGVSSNKFRSFLTLLGIIIGVGAVILMVSLGSGTQQVVSGQFESLNIRQVYLGSNYNLSYQQRGRLSLEDERYLEESALGVEDVVPFYRSYQSVKYGGKEGEVTVAGVMPQVLDLTSLKLGYGRSIETSDIKNRARIAVVPEEFMSRLTNLSDYSSLIGEKISIDGNKLLIVGVLGESNSTVALGNNTVLIPLTTYGSLWRRTAESISFYLVTYSKTAAEKDVMAQVSYLMDKRYGKVSGESRYIVQGLQQETDTMTNVIRVFSYVLGGIAAISLMVGGIGVMNIMLVTVKERTREIGVRRAIGATCGDIQKQFLMESTILSVGGGIMGILLGSLFSFLINIVLGQYFDWWQGNIPLWIIILSFGVTVGIGLIFGYYPAYKASKLDPIEALRYE